MTDTKSEKKTNSKSTISLRQVVDSFLRQYYQTLSKSPEILHKFYKEPSYFSHNFADSVHGVDVIFFFFFLIFFSKEY